MEPVFVNCQISLGAFSGERVFEVAQLEGGQYVGLSPLRYCYNASGEQLASSEPQGGDSIEGKLAVRRIDSKAESVRVAIPDGQAIVVPVASISDR